MELINAEQIRSHLDWRQTIDALERMFAAPCTAPPRHHHTITLDGREDATMLLMPAWAADRYVGVKVANVYPDNPSRGLPAIHGSYLLMNGTTGEPLALLDGGELTARRTVCASALAARYLSRAESRKLLIVGSGRLSLFIGLAHRAVRPIESISVWGRNREHAEAVARSYRQAGFEAAAAADLESASGDADIISCVTMSTQPLVLGRWLKPGAHLDLIGGFRPHMREVDSDAVARSTIFADTREGVLGEAGDLLIPIAEGRINAASIAAELRDLASSAHPGRTGTSEITLFKSVGTAIEDLAAAILCYERCINPT
jgi:ornithine cyclodeaminase